MFDTAISGFAEASKRANPRLPGDYEKDGLLYCGKCHTPKETIVKMFGSEMKLSCMCKCAEDEYKRAEIEHRERQRQYRIEQAQDEGFADKSLTGCRFENDDTPESQMGKTSRKYVEHFKEMSAEGKGLVFFGKLGTGKTYYAACIANALIQKGYKVLVTSFPRLSNNLMERMDGRQEYLDSLDEYDLIVIDDFSAERSTEYMMETVYTVVDARYKSGKPLIVTTNLTREQISDTNSDIRRARIISRLYEMCFFVESEGKDRRIRQMREDYGRLGEMLGLPQKQRKDTQQ